MKNIKNDLSVEKAEDESVDLVSGGFGPYDGFQSENPSLADVNLIPFGKGEDMDHVGPAKAVGTFANFSRAVWRASI